MPELKTSMPVEVTKGGKRVELPKGASLDGVSDDQVAQLRALGAIELEAAAVKPAATPAPPVTAAKS